MFFYLFIYFKNYLESLAYFGSTCRALRAACRLDRHWLPIVKKQFGSELANSYEKLEYRLVYGNLTTNKRNRKVFFFFFFLNKTQKKKRRNN